MKKKGKAAERTRQSFSSRAWLWGILLMSLTVLAYVPALNGNFLWDDDDHILSIKGLQSLNGLWNVWFRPGATIQYYPLTFTIFWVDYHLWGFSPLAYHLQNVLLHGLAAVFLWQILARLRVPGAWLAGAIFALHPVNVMSVAWMTELKNTLSVALVLGAVWAYLRFAKIGAYNLGNTSEKAPITIEWRFYALALALFQLALLAKTAVSFLPATLLLIVWWQRKRLQWRDVCLLIPMLIMAAGMGYITSHVEQHSIGATGEEFHRGILERILVSGRSFWFYLGKLVFPHPLIFFYPQWRIDAGAWWQYLYPISTVALLGGLWGMHRRIGKAPFAAMMHFYVCTSFLTLILTLYMTRYSFVSDHWQYFGCMSVIALAAAGITLTFELFGKQKVLLQPIVCGLLLVTLGMLTWRQSAMYSNSETLFRTTIERNSNAWMALNNLGSVLFAQGKVEEAIIDYREALRINPNNPEAQINLGNALLQQGHEDEAIAHYHEALRLDPSSTKAQYNLGNALLQQGRPAEAITQFHEALKLNPNNAEVHNNLGNAFIQQGQTNEALAHYREAVRINPNYALAHNNLGLVLQQQRNLDEAITQFRKALRADPHYAEACTNLGTSLLQEGKIEEGMAQLREAFRINPAYVDAYNNLGVALLQQRHIDEAKSLFHEAIRINPGLASAHHNLGLALLQEGQIEEGIAQFREAFRVNPAYVDAHNSLGDALFQQGRMEEAIAEFREAVRIDPNCAPAHFKLGIVLFQQGQAKEAIMHEHRSLALQSTNIVIQNALAWMLATAAPASLRDGAEAVQLATGASQSNIGGNNPQILRTLAAAYAEAGRFSEAMETAQRALQVAESQSKTAMAEALRNELGLYRANKPFPLPEAMQPSR